MYLQIYSLVRWIMILFVKIRKLMTSALWIQAMLRTRLILQPSFTIVLKPTFLFSVQIEELIGFYAMETLG